MAFFTSEIDRRVIPNWRNFGETCYMGELGSYRQKSLSRTPYPIDEYIESWGDNQNVLFASELIGAAVTNDQVKREEIVNAADFIIKNKDKANILQLDLANSIITNAEQVQDKIPSESLLDRLSSREEVWPKIAYLKIRISFYPYNPILYVEIARYYLLLGQEDKAKQMMAIAQHLAPNNRYVTRCSARMWLHYDELERAHDVICHNEMLKADPWLLASEISINMMRGRSSRYIKTAKAMLSSGNYDPFSITELASTIGTLEYNEGANKKSRDFFHQSLVRPNDNSLAQAEWAVSKRIPLIIKGKDAVEVKGNYEAMFRYKYQHDKFGDALEEAVDWLCDMPFSFDAALAGSKTAYIHLKKYDVAEKILNIALNAHPNDPTFLNNLAYTYALDGKIEEAEMKLGQLEKQTKEDADEITVCRKATKGLVAFKKKDVELGRSLYQEAITMAKDLGDQELVWNAILNYLREEMLATGVRLPEEVINEVRSIQANADQKYITALKEEVIALIEDRTIKPEGVNKNTL